MLDEKVIERQQAQLAFHRILYGVLMAFLCIVFCLNLQAATMNYLWLLIGTGILCVLEAIFSKFKFWNRFMVLCVFTYVQYAYYLAMMYLLHPVQMYLAMGAGGMMLVFMFEFSLYNEISNHSMSIKTIMILMAPAVICAALAFTKNGINYNSFYLLIAYAMFSVINILIVHLYFRNEERLVKQIQQLMAEIETIENDNGELTNVKNRIQKVNEKLNLQQVELAKMNKEIKQSNSELEAQAEILKFIGNAVTLDIPAVMNFILDVVMRIRKVEFCAIYIDANVCYNKKPYLESKCASKPDLKAFPEMERLFHQIKADEEERQVFRAFPQKEFPGISQTETRALLVLPLILDDEKYGIIVSGSKRATVFDNYIAFYGTVVPQINLAIHNIKLYAQMRHIAQTDGLTGINNRTHFNKLFAEQMEWTVTLKEPLTVALFDIDKFKRINDTYGHLVGDEVIKRIARIAAEHIEESELGFICRYGGEEFVIALPNMEIDQALPIIQGLHEKIASTTVEAYGYHVSMNVSIGVSSYPDICDDVNQLIKRADWSMYYAKEHGRGQIKVDGPDITEN